MPPAGGSRSSKSVRTTRPRRLDAHVRRLEAAVDEPGSMQDEQRLRDLPGHRAEALGIGGRAEPPGAFQRGLERVATDGAGGVTAARRNSPPATAAEPSSRRLAPTSRGGLDVPKGRVLEVRQADV